MLTAALLDIPVLAWFLAAIVLSTLAFGILVGLCIRGAETPPFEPTPQPEPQDLDDWLAAEEPLREFQVYRRPEAETHFERRAG